MFINEKKENKRENLSGRRTAGRIAFFVVLLATSISFLLILPLEGLATRDAEGDELRDFWRVMRPGIEQVEFNQPSAHNVTLGVSELETEPLPTAQERADIGWVIQFFTPDDHKIIGIDYQKKPDTTKLFGSDKVTTESGENDVVHFYIQDFTGGVLNGPVGIYRADVKVEYFCNSGPPEGCSKSSDDIVAIQTIGFADVSGFEEANFTAPVDLPAGPDKITSTAQLEKVKLRVAKSDEDNRTYFITQEVLDKALKSAGSPVVVEDDVSSIGTPVDFDFTEGGTDADQALYMAIDLDATNQSLIRKYTFDVDERLEAVSADIYTTDLDTTIAALALNRDPDAVGDPGVLILALRTPTDIEIRALDLETLMLGDVLDSITDETAEVVSLDTYFGSTPFKWVIDAGGVITTRNVDEAGVLFVDTSGIEEPFSLFGAQTVHAPELPAGMVPVFMTALSGMMFWLRSRFHR